MVSFEDDDDPINGSEEENEDEDENLEDEGDAEGEGDDMDADGDDMDAEGDNDDEGDQDNDDNDEEDDDQDENDNDNDNDNDNAGQDERDSASQSQSQSQSRRGSGSGSRTTATVDSRPSAPKVTLTSPSPRPSNAQSPSGLPSSFWPKTPSYALNASTYDIVPTMAAPQNTSINALAATPDMRWVFSGGTDGYIRMYNWVETANGKVPLTVAQKHNFVDSVMKGGSLTTYWENEEPSVRTPPAQSADEAKDKELSPVYSLATNHQALWLLSGLESGGINVQTCRHQAGTRIATLREHTSAVSVLNLAQDELSFLSGSWDKIIHDWDLNTGKVKRSYRGSGSQISAIERRPESSIPVPAISEEQAISSTFSSNNADKPSLNSGAPTTNGIVAKQESKNTENGTDDAAGSPDGSLFGDDGGSLFGDNDDSGNGASRSNNFDDDDEFSKAIANGLQQNEDDANNGDVEMADATMSGGPVQSPAPTAEGNDTSAPSDADAEKDASATTNGDGSHGNPHSEDVDALAMTQTTSADDTPAQTSESTFLDAAIDGTLRIWDRRMSSPIARIMPPRGTPPWCMAACWSPDGNYIYAGRRNQTVEEYSIHKGFQMAAPERTLRFPAESKAVSAVKMMPNGRHMVCASNDILRLYDLRHSETSKSASTTPFLIIPGHRTGVVSALHIDPSARFMISIAGNRGWEGGSTETLLGYEIHVPSS
ncbi:hypothetical protein AAFC00_000815 [Neodothiora populina]|uniref:Transcription factor spt8 beta-propeller domain-containing protein n=1 Tax=Neodothiora populina TaxID=2781224 RepID=A0ABR3PLT9_9PEZI